MAQHIFSKCEALPGFNPPPLCDRKKKIRERERGKEEKREGRKEGKKYFNDWKKILYFVQ